MRRGTLKLNPVYFRYLLSYVLVLLIPAGLLGYNGTLQLNEIVNQYVEWTNKDMLSQLADSVDTKIIEMNRISARISSNPDLTPYAVTKDPFSAYQTKQLLDYKVSNDFIHEVLYYVRGHDTLYSSVSTYRTSAFINDIYRFHHWPEAAFREELNSIKKPTLRTAEDVTFVSATEERYVSYLLPIPMGSLNPYGTVLFLIKESSFLNYLKPDAFPRSGNIMIYDEKQRIVTSYQGAGHIKEEALFDSIQPKGDLFTVSKLEGEEYFVSRLTSELTGWTYVSVLPVDDIRKPFHTVVGKWTQTFLIILLIGSAAIYTALRYNYNPIKKLVQLAETHLGKTLSRTNELETVRTLIDRILLSNRELGQKWEKHRSALHEHLLFSMLKGEVESKEQLDESSREAGLSFAFDYASYGVFVVEAPESAGLSKQQLADAIVRRSKRGITVHNKESLESSQMIFLLSTDYTEQQLGEWMAGWHSELYREYGIRLTCGVGRLQNELNQLGRSFIEASTAADYKFIKGAGQIIFFREVASEHASTLYDSSHNMEHLSYLLREGKTGQIAETLTHFTHKIKTGGTTLFVARCLCFDIIHTVMRTAEEMKQEFPEITGKFPDVITLMKFHTVEDLVDLITKACMDVCEAIQEHKGRSGESLIGQMIDYVCDRSDQYDFSVQSMAHHFSLSTSYVSRFFKEHTGQTISDYMNTIRINNAKRLLEESDASIKEIVQRIGYFDTSSFIRKFKAEAGVTPGEYRKMMRKQAGQEAAD
ncbi:helix-turn-helix domain-containing protein [Paenibacillus silviterrae]|uniref:helix-turn-helix domain-containing protein n=1 Tax=Paenibacillus silviterrae TaxID=3242194 RepID=UPI002543FA0D|nr:helix-turn-helix domain-containing protein [Paenibacillus chinjuensis]